ncbi:glycosyltransferase [Marinobacter sp. F4218]|uniref:glycosyltransferase n=1 Tax=Marinobacter sp. F4218 TaxID=2862868 RepID=UPI001C638D66|nr:glycosyltransferase [Marinobacter sp. F4218]MBW7470446.1 glycosyltransferase [Marinobacter sp. F4218]
MKILCVIDSLGSGGAQRQLVNLAIAFKGKGHDVSFLVYHSIPFYYEILEEQEISVIEVLESSYAKRFWKMRKVIRSGDYDSVLAFLQAASFICEISSFPSRKWRLVVGERSANPAILKSFKLKFFRCFHVFADAVVANSHENIKLVKKVNPLLPNEKLHVIYNLIDFEKWQPKPGNYVFKKDGKFNLIVVASHQYLKNLNGLVEAVNLLNSEEKDQLVVNWYGGERLDNSKHEALEKIEKYKLTKVFNFHDPTIDIAAKVNEADALGLFSFYEGLPNVICEAMVNSKPVISSDVSDVNLLIDDVLTFCPDDTKRLSRIVKHLLESSESDLESYGNENRARAVELFESKSIIEKYLEIFNKAKGA